MRPPPPPSMALVLPSPVCTPEPLYVPLDMLITTNLAQSFWRQESPCSPLNTRPYSQQTWEGGLPGGTGSAWRDSALLCLPGCLSEHRGVLSESSGNITGFAAAQPELPREDWGNLAWIKPCFGVWVYPGLLPLVHSLIRY